MFATLQLKEIVVSDMCIWGSRNVVAKLRLFVGLCHIFISCIMFNKKFIYCRETGLQQLAIVVQGTVT